MLRLARGASEEITTVWCAGVYRLRREWSTFVLPELLLEMTPILNRCHRFRVSSANTPTSVPARGASIARPLPQHGIWSSTISGQELISSGVVEGLNNKAKVTLRESYGFRTYRVLERALYHSLGKLPEPESTHDFFRPAKSLERSGLLRRYTRQNAPGNGCRPHGRAE